MPTRIATGLAVEETGPQGFAAAADEALAGLDGAPADLAVVFAGATHVQHAVEGLAEVGERLGPAALIGCGAQGVLAGGQEVEAGGVAVWAASMPGAEVETFSLEAVTALEGGTAVAGMPDLDGADAAILLVDPYSFPAEALLSSVGEEHPGLPLIGGLASSGGGPGNAVLMHDGAILSQGAVGVALAGVDVRPCVSQGARPLGPEMVITAGHGNVIHELASRPALSRLKEAIAELSIEERMLAAQGLLLGIVIDENQPEYERGDFLVRGLLSVDEETGSLTVGERVRVGQTVRMHVRDEASAHEDLHHALGRQLEGLSAPPAGALMFTCNGRGSHMFSTPHHDASEVEGVLGGRPVAGFFCAGEIGPVGPRSFLHGFTATLAVFAG